MLKKKIWPFQRIIELFSQKIVTKLLKIWGWDPGVKKAPDPDPQHCLKIMFKILFLHPSLLLLFLDPGSGMGKNLDPG